MKNFNLSKNRELLIFRSSWKIPHNFLRIFSPHTHIYIYSFRHSFRWTKKSKNPVQPRANEGRPSDRSTLVVKLFLPCRGTQEKLSFRRLRRISCPRFFDRPRSRSPISQAYKCSCRLRCHNPLKNSAVIVTHREFRPERKTILSAPCPVTNTGFSAGRSISCQSPANPFIPNRLNHRINKPWPWFVYSSCYRSRPEGMIVVILDSGIEMIHSLSEIPVVIFNSRRALLMPRCPFINLLICFIAPNNSFPLPFLFFYSRNKKNLIF